MDPSIIPALLHRFQTHPMADHATPWVLVDATRPRGMFSSFRASSMTREILNCTRMDGGVWDRLQTVVYTVSTTPYLDAVVGIARDGTVRWLDDDLQDDDFSTFVQHEQLAAWIPDAFEDLVTLLIATKCAYLMLPRLVGTTDDIPPWSRTAQQQSPADYAAEVALRAALAPAITPPRWTQHQDGTLQIDACVWTPILGRLFAITWVLARNGLVRYTGTRLADGVGACTILR